MEKLKVKELKKELFTGDFGDCFCDYDNGYICDIITEIADNHIDIYTVDLLNWCKDNYTYIEEALDEFGTPKNSNGNADFLKIIQQGQYLAFEQDLYNNLEDNLKNFTYNYILNELKIEEITEEQKEKILDFDFTDNNEQLENIIEYIRNIFEKEV